MLLPPLRQAALQTRPSWADAAVLSPSAAQGVDASQEAVLASVRQEAAAVLNVGQRLHSEGQLGSQCSAVADCCCCPCRCHNTDIVG